MPPVAKILLVEDNSINQMVAEQLLRKLGLECRVVSNGEEAVRLTAAEDFGLVFMDCQMPILDGYEATRLIRAQTKNAALPIIAMTAHAMKGDREKCLAAGMDDYLPKPISIEALKRIVNRYLFPTPGGVDFERLELITSGDMELQLQLIRLFLDDSTRRLGELFIALKAEDRPVILRLAHTIKGAASNMGAVDVADACAEMEKSWKEGLIPAADGMDRITAAMARTRKAYEAFIQSH